MKSWLDAMPLFLLDNLLSRREGVLIRGSNCQINCQKAVKKLSKTVKNGQKLAMNVQKSPKRCVT